MYFGVKPSSDLATDYFNVCFLRDGEPVYLLKNWGDVLCFLRFARDVGRGILDQLSCLIDFLGRPAKTTLQY